MKKKRERIWDGDSVQDILEKFSWGIRPGDVEIVHEDDPDDGCAMYVQWEE